MQNYFYDILPNDIQLYIFQIRLTKQLEKIYHDVIMQRNILINIINTTHKYNNNNVLFYENTNTNIFSRNKENYWNVSYLNPSTITSKYLTKKFSKVMSFNFYSNLSKKDKITLLGVFIRPLERGLVIYKEAFEPCHYNITYYETESYYLDIMMKLKIKIDNRIFNMM
tara:strand:+ start:5121 stop:5624 length:504 start_codon:yes stop_codon:yes gene_type:complete